MKALVKPVVTWSKSLLSLAYPANCEGCGEAVLIHEETICTACQYGLSYTRFHNDPNNQVSKIFWGRVPIQAATALCYFKQKGKIQELMHSLKYGNRPEVGHSLGLWLGRELASCDLYQGIDLVVPVPLHPKKLKIRGYNQCDSIAEGLAEGLGCESALHALVRQRHNATQTRKSRFARWQNTDALFAVHQAEAVKNKSVLLVDDVVTTGSTLEACAHALLRVEGAKVSIATLACA